MYKYVLFVLFFSLTGHAQIITTVAGGGTGDIGDGGPATAANIFFPSGVRFDTNGNLYISEMNRGRVRKVDTSGIITTVAGVSAFGHYGDGGPATAAYILSPWSLALDRFGNIFIAESAMAGDFSLGPWVRKVSSSGIITSYAGSTTGYSGDGGPATAAAFKDITDLAVDKAGNVFVLDGGNRRIRKIGLDGIVTTIAGNGANGDAGDGGPATAASCGNMSGIAIDKDDNIFIAGAYVRKVDAVTGIITSVAGTGSWGFSGDGGAALDATLGRGTIAVDDSGIIYLAEQSNNRVRKIDRSGIITTIAGNGTLGFTGDGGPAVDATVYTLFSVCTNAHGDVFIADAIAKSVRKICMKCGGLGVAHLSATDEIGLFPDPASSVINLVAPTEITRLSIFDASGRLIESKQHHAKNISVDISHLVPGSYYMQINGTITKQFLKD